MKKTAAFIILWCAIIFLIEISPASGQKKEVALQDKKITIKMDKQPLGNVFRYLMETYDISIGFEQSILDRGHSDYSFLTNLPSVAKAEVESTDGEVQFEIEAEREFFAKKHPITVEIKDGTLAEALNKIVDQMANYKWEIHDGVVNIFPINGRENRFAELLETKIENFSLASGKTVNDITLRIVGLKEFSGWMRRNKFHFNLARTGSTFLLDAQYGRILNNAMNFSDLSFRELLNKITKSKKGGWILKWQSLSKKGEEYIFLDI